MRYVWLLFVLILLASCGSEDNSPRDGYWRLKPPLQSRSLNNMVLMVKGETAYVLSYFGGPMLEPGVNTEGTPKKLVGTMRCGRLTRTDEGDFLEVFAVVTLDAAKYQEVDQSFALKAVSADTMEIVGITRGFDGPYVRESDLLNEELAAFESLSGMCQ